MSNCIEQTYWRGKNRLKAFVRRSRIKYRRVARWCAEFASGKIPREGGSILEDSLFVSSKEHGSDDEEDEFYGGSQHQSSASSSGVTLWNRLPIGWNSYERDVAKMLTWKKNAKRIGAFLVLAIAACLFVSYTISVSTTLYEEETVSLRASLESNDAFISMWYHAHVDILSYDSINELARDADIAEPCRKITYAEYVTRFLGHDTGDIDAILSDKSNDLHKYNKGVADLDLDLLSHMLCHVASDLHEQDPTRAMYVTPKMLNVSEFHVASKFKDEDAVGDFAVHDRYDAENVCIMAYIRPVKEQAGQTESDDKSEHSHGSTKVYEAALNITDDVFVHSTDIGLTQSDDSSRYYVHRNDSSSLYNTRTWWNSALFLDGEPGECVLFVNADLRVDGPNIPQDNRQFEVVRSSMLLSPPSEEAREANGGEEPSKVLFSSKVWKHGVVHHDMVLEKSQPDLAAFEDNLFESHDGARTSSVDHLLIGLEQSAEPQVVVSMMHGRWNIFDEIRRAMKTDV